LKELSLKNFDENDQFNGAEHIFPAGYSQIIDAIAKDLDVTFNCRVSGINYEGDAC